MWKKRWEKKRLWYNSAIYTLTSFTCHDYRGNFILSFILTSKMATKISRAIICPHNICIGTFFCTCIYDFIINYCSLLTDFPERKAGRLEWDYSEQGMNKPPLFQDIAVLLQTTTVVAIFINVTIKQIVVFRAPHQLTHNLLHQKPTLSIFPFKVGGLVAVMKTSN